MSAYKGVTVSKGIAIGPALVQMREVRGSTTGRENETSRDDLNEEARIETELERFESALDQTKKRMDKLVLDTGVRAGRDAAQIFLMHKLILEGSEFKNLSRLCIEEGHMNADEAARYVGEALAGRFADMDDEYMRARADDVKDITNEMIDILNNPELAGDGATTVYPYVLVTDTILPSDVATIDQDSVLAIVTTQGSPTSHAAILAHMMDIPMVVSVPLDMNEIEDQTPIYVNADTGEVIVSPDVDFAEEVKRHTESSRGELKHLIGQETITSYGQRIELYANISSIADMRRALDNDAEGIGLYRTEFMYMDRDEPVGEDEQYAVYKKLLMMCPNKYVTIRTMDLGGDKTLTYLDAGDRRGLEVSLVHKELFKTQLRALVRASVHGRLRVMYPMVTGVQQLIAANSIMGEVKWALLQDVGACRFLQGVMIETPEAVSEAAELAEHADFFSIGSNDLTHLLYGIDRENGDMSAIDDDYEMLFDAIAKTVRAAHAAGITVGLCGEIAGNRQYTARLIKTGIDCLSVVPSDILVMRDHIRNC